MKTMGLPRAEILRNRTQIRELFNKGHKLVQHPLLMYYLPLDGKNQVYFTVPKRRIRKAVDRNLVKRRIKEAYRLSKHLVPPLSEGPGYQIAFLYIANEPANFQEVQEKIILLLQRLAKPDEKPVK